MNFDSFTKSIPKIKNIPLPGSDSQFKMSPPFREELVKKYRSKIPFAKKAGVMALVFPDKENNSKMALILRKSYQGVHSAQIGFPGGRFEKGDTDLKHTALRETEEEIGIQRQEIKVIKELTDLYIPPSNFLVTPFMGYITRTPTYLLDEIEVEAVVEASLSDILHDSSSSSARVMTSLNQELEVPTFNVAGHIVWGATAMMLSEIKDLLKRAL